MEKIVFKGMPSNIARHLRNGRNDANGLPAERAISEGNGLPCRHCLQMIEKGAPYLIVSYKPFSTTQAYAEQGPIFLHAQTCQKYTDNGELPPIFDSAQYIIRGYDKDERIIYGTSNVVEREMIMYKAQKLLEDRTVQFLHIRSATNNCWQGRIVRK